MVTRRALAAAFSKVDGYFNTFGGNPVSCAAALAVLDVLEEENLQANAATQGRHIVGGLESLAERHPLIRQCARQWTVYSRGTRQRPASAHPCDRNDCEGSSMACASEACWRVR